MIGFDSSCTGGSNKRNFIGNQTMDVHEISDSDDQFDQPRKGKKAHLIHLDDI